MSSNDEPNRPQVGLSSADEPPELLPEQLSGAAKLSMTVLAVIVLLAVVVAVVGAILFGAM